jgi:hypothetical protein
MAKMIPTYYLHGVEAIPISPGYGDSSEIAPLLISRATRPIATSEAQTQDPTDATDEIRMRRTTPNACRPVLAPRAESAGILKATHLVDDGMSVARRW